jgi:hypothetical protein
MKGIDFSGKDHEASRSSVEHERWTNAILRALHELRCASASGLDKHFCDDEDVALRRPFVSPLAGSIPPPEPRTTH